MNHKYTLEDVRGSYKKKDSWWTVYLVDPVASRLILPTVNYTNITPNQLTVLAFLLGLTAAYQYYLGTFISLITGAFLYHLSFICDCMDGKISRLKGTGSMFGGWLDYILDRTRVAICAFVLMFTHFKQTGDTTYLYLGFLICLLDSTRYMTSLLVLKLKNEMEKKLKSANIALKKEMQANRDIQGIARKLMKLRVNYIYRLPKAMRIRLIEGNTFSVKSGRKLVWKEKSQREIESRFKSYMKIRNFLLKRRVRLHLFSGIEYQMFIFIIGPITGFMKEMVIVSSILIFVFEVMIVYKLWLSTIDYERKQRKMDNQIKALNASITDVYI
jgi:phosphatidylglycerophosphate synthase